jgi:hypothetical protein
VILTCFVIVTLHYKGLFETTQLYQLQLNFTTEQLSLRVGELDGSV